MDAYHHAMSRQAYWIVLVILSLPSSVRLNVLKTSKAGRKRAFKKYIETITSTDKISRIDLWYHQVSIQLTLMLPTKKVKKL